MEPRLVAALALMVLIAGCGGGGGGATTAASPTAEATPTPTPTPTRTATATATSQEATVPPATTSTPTATPDPNRVELSEPIPGEIINECDDVTFEHLFSEFKDSRFQVRAMVYNSQSYRIQATSTTVFYSNGEQINSYLETLEIDGDDKIPADGLLSDNLDQLTSYRMRITC